MNQSNVLSLLFMALPFAVSDAEEKHADVHRMEPTVGTDELVRMARASREAGLKYLVDHQNPDGSFGSHDPRLATLADFGFQLRHRGSQNGVRTACTALSAQALLETRRRTDAEDRALELAIEDLLRPVKIAYDKSESFNTWGYGYKLDFLLRLLDSPVAAGREDRIRAAADVCVHGLIEFQQHEGGWGYYSDVQNDFDSMCFNTAVFGLALHRAEAHGIDVPPGMPRDAMEIVLQQRCPDGSFVYSSSHIGRGSSMLMNLGAGSRTAACALALYEVGRYDAAELDLAMHVFRNGENYLEKGRKLIVPHSAPHAVSGYFFFFGYYYAAEVMARLGDGTTQAQWDRHAWQMIRTQEEDGRWWDTASGHYGEMWGTAFALLTLDRYLDAHGARTTREL